MKQFIKPLLLTSFILSLALNSFAEYQSLDTIKVIVDDDVITQSDLDKEIGIVKRNLAGQNNIQLPSEKEIREHVTNNLILKSLQLQLALRSGVTINEEQLNDAITTIAKRNGFDNLQDFRQKLDSEGITFQEMREKIRQDLTIQRVQQGHLRNRIQVSEQEIKNFLDSAEGKKITATRYKVSHLLLPLNSKSTDKTVNKAKAELTKIRQQLISGKYQFKDLVAGKDIGGNKLSGTNLGWGELNDMPSLFAKIIPKMQKGQISEPIRSGAGWHLLKLEDITGGSDIIHQTSVRHILIKPSEVRTEEQVENLANSLYQRLQEGEDFSLLAKEYSEDPGSALQGGDLGWSNPGQFVPAFEDTMNKLKDNEISKPFKSRYGWHIVQKLGERDHDMTTENWMNQAYQAIYEKKFSDELESWLQKIREEAFVEIK